MGTIDKSQKRLQIKKRIRKQISGTPTRPRLTVFRSNKEIYAQVIDDLAGSTLVSASSKNEKTTQGVAKIEQAKLIGQIIAKKAIKEGINEVVFDRSGYLYHGRIKSLAEAAREEGLKF
jgi:large subunit ribosomal protein L18